MFYASKILMHDVFKMTSVFTDALQYYKLEFSVNITITIIWANAQRDGHPAKYRWRLLFNAAKFGWCPLPECHAVMLPRRETCWNLLGCPKLTNRSQPLVGRSSPYCEDTSRRHCCLTSFIPIAHICEQRARQSCAKVRRWWIFGDFLRPVFHQAAWSKFQTCTLNSH